MKTAYRFILKAYLGPMVFTFFIVMFILLMHFLWMRIDELVGKGLSLSVIFELIMYAMLTMIPMGLPLATLLASIMTMGDLGENNELLALKSAGVSLPKIMKPLIILMVVVCMSSFFIINNLTPYAYQKMYSLLYDIRQQKHEMKFEDGIFFNGIPNMSIRVERQDPVTRRLDNVLIYDNSQSDKMRTILADSGFIQISEDRKYLEVILFSGQTIEETRNYAWYDNNVFSVHIFDRQDALIPLSGFAFERGDMEGFKSHSQTRNLAELKIITDSLKHVQDSLIHSFTNSLMGGMLFHQYREYSSLDSIPDKPGRYIVPLLDTMSAVKRSEVFDKANDGANLAKNNVQYDQMLSNTSSELYKAQISKHRKFTLPFSIMIFFLIGAPLGAIIRKGGLGMPIVVSIAFFVFNYIIDIAGERLVRDGAIPAYIGVWIASLILFPLAIFLTHKSTNDSALLNAEVYRIKINRAFDYCKKIINEIRNYRNDKNIEYN